MNERRENDRRATGVSRGTSERGSVLIIVIWVCLGLVALTLYFANSMSAELRAAENRVAETEARQAVAAGTRYAAYILTQFGTNGTVPQLEEYSSEALAVGDAQFWFIGRDPDQLPTNEPVFGLVDESSKINLNTASRGMLEALPGITPELVEAILSWRRRSGDPEGGGADGNTYSRLDPPRTNKSAPFETVDELRLVYGATLEQIFGEDTNRNGVLDANEDDGEQTAPRDDQNGQLLAGITEYVTVYSRQPSRRSDGGRKINISTPQGRMPALALLLQRRLEPGRAMEIIRRIGDQRFDSVAEFMWDSGMTPEEYALVHGDFTTRDGTVTGLINVNTASEVVLSCIPGIGVENASALVGYRLAHPDLLTSFAWLRDVLPRSSIARAGQYITDHSYQFSADVVAVGRLGRGYARARTIFDMSNGIPRIVYHQDLTHYGWALGPTVREWTRPGRDAGT
ncbi:MAG: type II secretion system protein GspK [Opitutaceae bacterium]|nr:type II secretion system protein GspK [Opitutaceae bacterium]